MPCSVCRQTGHTRAKCVSAKAVYARTYYHVTSTNISPDWKHVKGLTEEYCYEQLVVGAKCLLMAFDEVEDKPDCPEYPHPDWDGVYKRPLYLYGNATTLTPPTHHQDAINAKRGVTMVVKDGEIGCLLGNGGGYRKAFLTQMERMWKAKMYSGLQADTGYYQGVDSYYKDCGLCYGNFRANAEE